MTGSTGLEKVSHGAEVWGGIGIERDINAILLVVVLLGSRLFHIIRDGQNTSKCCLKSTE